MAVRSVYISGMHSGPNPSPGLGVARSLRAALPALRIVGIDYSTASSGLHSALLDERVSLPSWEEVDHETWLAQVTALVEDLGAVLVPTLDLEVRLLAEGAARSDRILSPGKAAIDCLGKPPLAVARALDLPVAPHETDVTRRNVERFLRSCPYGVWVKGQHYEAFRAHTVTEVVAAGAFLEEAWGGGWHLEAHLPGQECGLAFCAADGVLLDAVLMEKTALTAEGKTWSGQVREVPAGLRGRLAEFVAATEWSGGGELELVAAWDGTLTLMELNPRFPAWVHGATACGANLPAALVSGRPAPPDRSTTSDGFTRVVEEIAVDRHLGLAPFPWGPADVVAPASKHPSGMRDLSRRNLVPVAREARGSAPGDETEFAGLGGPDGLVTPARQLVPARLARQVAALRGQLTELPAAVLAYSVKTCPAPVLLAEAARLGLVAEVISLDELDAAGRAGFAREAALLNGPAKWWPARDAVRCGAFFADSLAELEQLRRRLDAGFRLTTQVVGVRLAPASVPSRFGVDVSGSADLDRVAELVGELCRGLGAGWGVHFHHAESLLGPVRWRTEAARTLALADRIEDRLGRAASLVDVGGGWHVDDLPVMGTAHRHVVEHGPRCLREGAATLVLEPGKLLSEPAGFVVTQVLLVHGAGVGVVVDGALAEVPEARYRDHPVARHDGARWRPLPPGRGRILGRSCMEDDVLAEGVDLAAVREGDHLAFGRCGAYDLSMSYEFGRGRCR